MRSSAAPSTRRGARTSPESMAAATVAIPSGENVTVSCPIEAAAIAVRPRGAGTSASNAGTPSSGVRSSPNRAATAGKSPGRRCDSAIAMNDVLHDSAKAWSSVRVGPSPSALWNVSPSTVIVGGHATGLAGDNPARIRAALTRTLNVDPGG